MKACEVEITKKRQAAPYVLEYEARYFPAKSPAPRLARLVLDGDRLERVPIDIPRVGTGRILVRLRGAYTVHDGEVFESIEGLYAEVFVVCRGLQFALWWGDPEEIGTNEPRFVEFLAGSVNSRLHFAAVFERELGHMKKYGIDCPGRESALIELVEGLRAEVAGRSNLPVGH